MDPAHAQRPARRAIKYSLVGATSKETDPDGPVKKKPLFKRQTLWWKLHFFAFLLHLAHTLVMYIPDFRATGTLFVEYSVWEERESHHDGPPFDIYPSLSQAGRPIELKYFVGAFTLLSATFHLGYALCYLPQSLGGRVFESIIGYKRQFKQRAVVARFVEYSMSASLMLCLLAYFSGIRTLWHLILIGTISIATQACGILIERNLRLDGDKFTPEVYTNNWILWGFGAFYLVVVFVDILFSIGISDAHTPSTEPQMPDFVWGIVIGELGIYFCFGIVQLVRMIVDHEKRNNLEMRELYFSRAELAYIILSIIAKSALAWTVFGNVLMLDR